VLFTCPFGIILEMAVTSYGCDICIMSQRLRIECHRNPEICIGSVLVATLELVVQVSAVCVSVCECAIVILIERLYILTPSPFPPDMFVAHELNRHPSYSVMSTGRGDSVVFLPDHGW